MALSLHVCFMFFGLNNSGTASLSYLKQQSGVLGGPSLSAVNSQCMWLGGGNGSLSVSSFALLSPWFALIFPRVRL